MDPVSTDRKETPVSTSINIFTAANIETIKSWVEQASGGFFTAEYDTMSPLICRWTISRADGLGPRIDAWSNPTGELITAEQVNDDRDNRIDSTRANIELPHAGRLSGRNKRAMRQVATALYFACDTLITPSEQHTTGCALRAHVRTDVWGWAFDRKVAQ